MLRKLLFPPRAIGHLLLTAFRDRSGEELGCEGTLNDAGAMSETKVSRLVRPVGDLVVIERQLAQVLAEAKEKSVGVSVIGARHSMGGQSLAPNGFAIDLSELAHLDLDEANRVLTVGAGARWAVVLPFLAEHGLSVHVMQSYNTFSVGGSVSVNCHGDQLGCAPISSTVLSLRVMVADGTIIQCSRTENQELFSLILGGYGLFGIVLDVRLRVVRNTVLSRCQTIVPTGAITAVFSEAASATPRREMIYARPSIAPGNFLRECFVEELVTVEGSSQPSSTPAWKERLSRYVFLGTFGSNFGKELRWRIESFIAPAVMPKQCSRRDMQDDCAEKYKNRTGVSTEVIHEYFLPRGCMPEFVEVVRELVMESGADLVNASIRTVEEDRDTFLRYADQPILSLVLMFHRSRDDSDEDRMKQLMQLLIDAALDLGGRYYLPYRMHATPSQLKSAYPMITEFFEAKRRYDPHEVFSNRFYTTYGHAHVAAKTN